MNSLTLLTPIATLSDNFITVTTSSGSSSYGGDQRWFQFENPHIKSFGCGIIAAINTYLYIIGKKNITQEDYMLLCKTYLKEHPFSNLLLYAKFGVTPLSMQRFIKSHCMKTSASHRTPPSPIPFTTKWNWKNDWEKQYQLMLQMLHCNIPVILGIHSQKKNTLPLYCFNSQNQHKKAFVTSHYVTVTGIYECSECNNHSKRYLKVSSWGEEYFIDYDEFNQFRNVQYKNNNTSTPKGKPVHFPLIPYYKLANMIGSNILIIQPK